MRTLKQITREDCEKHGYLTPGNRLLRVVNAVKLTNNHHTYKTEIEIVRSPYYKPDTGGLVIDYKTRSGISHYYVNDIFRGDEVYLIETDSAHLPEELFEI